MTIGDRGIASGIAAISGLDLSADSLGGSVRRKRVRACIDPEFRTRLLVTWRFRIFPCSRSPLSLQRRRTPTICRTSTSHSFSSFW
jgi:hypothetical protein